ncbi:FadR/GntR family transcriptional regulator [Rathayibacter soli]|uniref:FadR/GntR family transcriptional regulator n=1 Tax=Rathayibacter soli TaxID=3144168 RepID=UPI0027E5645B|nr:FadR/GntR family transcriptional regulator [Glaciibacter superstes]
MNSKPSDHDGDAAASNARSQTDVVVEEIKRMITNGSLKAGSRLPVEKELAVSLGVSRGSLREGVRALCIMGVLETRQGDGTYVTSLEPSLLLAPMSFMVDLHSPDHGPYLQSVRRVLETEAAGLAARFIGDAAITKLGELLTSIEPMVFRSENLDHNAIMEVDIAFHRVIARASENPALEALIEALASRTIRTRMWRAISETGAVQATHAEHRAIQHALAAHDPDAARLRMGTHLLAVEEFSHQHGAQTPEVIRP